MSPRLWFLFGVTSLLWIVYPQIDLETSALFYLPSEGFYLKGVWWETLLYRSVAVLLIIFNAGALFLALYNYRYKKNLAGFNGRKVLYTLLVLGVGSGLFVNALLKEHWGRARPVQITEFGGNRHFTPAFVPSDQQGNSFSCGHASGAFALMAFAFLTERRRRVWIALALSYGVLVSYARLAAGGHFLSDIVVSFFIMFLISKLLYFYMFKKEKTLLTQSS